MRHHGAVVSSSSHHPFLFHFMSPTVTLLGTAWRRGNEMNLRNRALFYRWKNVFRCILKNWKKTEDFQRKLKPSTGGETTRRWRFGRQGWFCPLLWKTPFLLPIFFQCGWLVQKAKQPDVRSEMHECTNAEKNYCWIHFLAAGISCWFTNFHCINFIKCPDTTDTLPPPWRAPSLPEVSLLDRRCLGWWSLATSSITSIWYVLSQPSDRQRATTNLVPYMAMYMFCVLYSPLFSHKNNV